MESFTDLLSDAFSETSAPSFPEEDLDFENLNFDEKCGDDEAESVSRKTDGALLQEATGETTALCGEDEKDVLCLSGNVCKSLTEDQSEEEDFEGAGVSLVSINEAPEEDYTSSEGEYEEEDSEEEDSEEEDSASEDDEEEGAEKPGDLLMSVGCTDEVYITEKEDRIFAEGQPLALQGAGDPQVSNKEQGDDDFKMRRSSQDCFENKVQQGPQHKYPLEDSQFHRGSGSFSSSLDDDLMTNNGVNPTYLVSWDFDVLKTDAPQPDCVLATEDADKTQTPASGVSPSEHVNSYSVVMREDTKTTRPSYQGSLDDSFFFNTEMETSGVTEVGQKGNNEFEEERNWDQEQERIKAFFEYYDDSDEQDGREGRQIKVQFSAEPLSQVIHYESDSDADSLSSSTDREEDPSSADASDELGEPRDSQQMNPECDPANAQVHDNLTHHSNTQIRARRQRCLNMLKWILKMVLVVVTGLAVYWLLTDQADWLGQVFFF